MSVTDEEILSAVKSGAYVLFPAKMPESIYAAMRDHIKSGDVANETQELIVNVLSSVWGLATGISYLYDGTTNKFYPQGDGCGLHPSTAVYRKETVPDFIKERLSTAEEIMEMRAALKAKNKRRFPTSGQSAP